MKVLIVCQDEDIFCLFMHVFSCLNPDVELLLARSSTEAICASMIYGHEIDGTIIWDAIDIENGLAFDIFLLSLRQKCHVPVVAAGADIDSLRALMSRGCTLEVPSHYYGTTRMVENHFAPRVLLKAMDNQEIAA